MLCAVPLDVRAWLEVQAARNLAPMSSVMVASIRKVMEAEQQEDARSDRETVG
jgi:DNA-binding GntR family transcriptional regulator